MPTEKTQKRSRTKIGKKNQRKTTQKPKNKPKEHNKQTTKGRVISWSVHDVGN